MPANLRILLVEDNEGDVEMTQHALRDLEPPCDISVANDGLEALEFLRKEDRFAGAPPPELILLDLNMPRMDGKRFLETVKNNARLRTIPVVVLTSSESPTDIQECYERQANCYVVKPFDTNEFCDAIRQVVYFWSGLGRLPRNAA